MSPLTFLTLAYLAIPNLIFFVGWLRPGVLLLALVSIALAFYFQCRKSPVDTTIRLSTASARSLVVSGLLALVWVAFSGVGGLGAPSFDWVKHFSVLRDLIVERWPVIYQDPTTAGIYLGRPLVYYVGYYLPAAAFGKAFGWTAGNVAIAVWTWLGLVLTFQWLGKLARPRSFALLIVLFVFFSGLDVVGNWLNGIAFKPGDHIEWWTDWFFQYPSNTSQLFWVPQHALPAWLGTSLLLDRLTDARPDDLSRGLAVSYHWAPLLCLIWSPFAVLGFIPLWSWNVWKNRREFLGHWSMLAFAVLAVLIFGSFYRSNHAEFPKHEQISRLLQHPKGVAYYLELVVLDVLIVSLLPLAVADRQPWRRLLWCCLGCLLVFPLYRIGHYNDLVMRASMPVLFCLFLCWARALPLALQNRQRTVLLAAAAVYLLGAVTPMNEFLRTSRGLGFHPSDPQQVTSTPLLYGGRSFIAAQYIGEPNSSFYRYLASRSRR